METLGCHLSKGAEVLFLVFAKKTMRVIFDHGNTISVGDFHDCIHFAGHPRIMDHYNGTCSWRNQSFKPVFIKIEGIRPNISKNWLDTSQSKSIDRGDKGK